MFIIKQYVHNYTEQTYNTIYICIVLAQKHIQKTGLYSCYIYIHCIHINPTVARGFFSARNHIRKSWSAGPSSVRRPQDHLGA